MLIDRFENEELQERLKNYPYLEKYVNSFNERNGIAEEVENMKLPYLVIWFRRALAKSNIEPEDLFEWDEDTTEDFYSWGSNSRWNHTFRSCLECDLEFYVEKALELADKYKCNDINIEESIQK